MKDVSHRYNPWRSLSKRKAAKRLALFKRNKAFLMAAKRPHESFQKSGETNMRMLKGTLAAGGMEEDSLPYLRDNYALSRFARSVMNVYIRDPEVLVEPRATAEGLHYDQSQFGFKGDEEQNLKGMASLFKNLIQNVNAEADMEGAVTRAIRDSRTFGFGCIKVSYFLDDGTMDGLVEREVITIEDQARMAIAKSKNPKDAPASGGDEEKAEDARQEYRRQTLERAREGEGVSSRSVEGVKLTAISPRDVFFDAGIADFSDIKRSRFIAHQFMMGIDEASSTFGIPPATLRAQSKGDNSKEPEYPSVGASGQEPDGRLKIVEFYDRIDGLVWHFIDGCEFPLADPKPTTLHGKFFYPYHFFPDMMVASQRYPIPSAQLLHAAQDRINAKVAKKTTAIANAKSMTVLNTSLLSEGARSSIKKQNQIGAIVEVENSEAKVGDAVEVVSTIDPQAEVAFDTGPERNTIEHITGDIDSEMNVRTKSATEVDELAATRAEKQSLGKHGIERRLSEICRHELALCLAHMSAPKVAEYHLNENYFPEVDPKFADEMVVNVMRLYDISVQSGSTDKPNEREEERKATAMAQQLAPILQGDIEKQIAILGSQYIVTPEMVDMLSEPLRNVMKHLAVHTDDTIDPESVVSKRMTEVMEKMEEAGMLVQAPPPPPGDGQ